MRAADLAAPRLYAGYEMGYYCVCIKGDIELAARMYWICIMRVGMISQY